ncbi:MAG TPA: hypothetical protein DDZ51_16940 [Planctomycetaceae bacterium]|nr:hypothetical protein [Planctomycetaceae bacterium]
MFQIDATTGIVTTAAAIDREAHGPIRSITVQTTSSDGSTATQTFNIAINDLDEFDVTTPTDTDASENEVDENVAIGTTVGITANAFDLDATTNTITYSLTSNADNLFAIDATTGVVTTAAAIDREAHGAIRSITVQATSSDGSTATQTFDITINDLDEFGVTTPTDSDTANNEVDENVAIGTTVGITANAFDLDATTNTITYSLTSNPDNLFQIDANTGVVTTAAAIDREAHGAARSITVQATSSDGSTAIQTFDITINDLDEFDVTVPTDTDTTNNEIDENVAIGTTVGITANAFDLDATTNAITYSLTSNPDNLFQIDANTGVVTTAAAIDREAHGAARSITVQATSSDGSTASQTFNIAINDLDEFDVTVPTDSDLSNNEVDENVAIGTTVGITASAFDLDATNNAITYSLSSNPDGLFQIDANTGIVTTAASIDREAHGAARSITVQATSSDGSSTTQVFSIEINDINEFDVNAISDNNANANTVSEDASIGTVVGITAFAVDADATNNEITYTLDDDAGGLFAINAITGVVTVAAGLDYETEISHSINVRATSSDGSSSTEVFTIEVTDVNESAVTAISDTDPNIDYVLENSEIGTIVGVQAFADDADGTDTVSYTLDDNAGGRFAINASTGVVTVAGIIDREDAASYNITIRATSTDTSFNTQVFTIAIGDINEFEVTIPTDTDIVANEVHENAANGTTVGIQAFASDADATNNTITYSLDDTAGGRFTIDPTTGVVTVADGSLLNFEDATSHQITVRAASIDGSTATTVMVIQVIDVNENPVAVSDAATATEAGGVSNASTGTNPTGNVLDNDTDVDANDTKSVIGVGAGIQAFTAGSVASAVNGMYGFITIADDGSYTYIVDNDNAAVQALASAADTLQDVFTYTMRDTAGLTSTTQVTITIEGANDSPIISLGTGDSQSATLVESNAGLTTHGTLSVTDVDVSNTVTATVTNVVASGTTGNDLPDDVTLLSMLSIHAGVITSNETTGKIDWVFDSSGEAFNYLAVGESLALTFTIAVEDSAGAVDTEEVTITIQGTNDIPVAFAGNASGNEDDTVITGQLIASEIDASDTLTFSLASGPSSGSVSIETGGAYVFSPGNDFQDLALGESREVTFVYDVADNQGATDRQTVTVTVFGRNDSPVITITGSDRDTTHLIETGTTLTTTGTMSVSDIDRSDVVTATVTGVTIGGDVAGMTANAAEVLAMFSITQTVIDQSSQSGSLQWWFDSQNEYFDYLLTNETVHLTYEITVADQHGLVATRQAHIHITTDNRAPIATADSYTILPTERLTLAAPGPLVNDYDPDGDAIQFVLVSGPTWGTLTIAANGSLTYRPGAQYAALDTIRYRVTDGRLFSETVEIQIITRAAPLPDNPAPPAPVDDSGPGPSIESRVDTTSGDSASIDVAADNTDSASQLISNGGAGSVNGQLIAAMEYSQKSDRIERINSSERMLQSAGWVFGQDFQNIGNENRSLVDQLRMRRDDMIASIMTNASDDLLTQLNNLKLGTAIITTANATLSAATAGTIFWALRGAALVATVASGMPALRNLDPANLLAEYRSNRPTDENEDELESLVEVPQSIEK